MPPAQTSSDSASPEIRSSKRWTICAPLSPLFDSGSQKLRQGRGKKLAGSVLEKITRLDKRNPPGPIASLVEGVLFRPTSDKIALETLCSRCGKTISESPARLALDMQFLCTCCGNSKYVSRSQLIVIRQELDKIEQMTAIENAKKSAKIATIMAKKHGLRRH